MNLKIKEWHWEITRKCNLLCKHCISDCNMSCDEELSIQEIVKAVKAMKILGCERIMITGGEPLCFKGFWKLLEECKKQDIAVNFLTNGVLINHKLVKRLIGLVASIGISIDGSTSEINDSIRGVGSFKKSIQALEMLREYFPVSVFFTVSALNINDLEESISLFKSLGIETIHISEINMWGRALRNSNQLSIANKKEYLRGMAIKSTKNSKPEEDCTADFSSLYISYDGFVYPCSEIAFCQPDYNLGKITSSRFKNGLKQKIRSCPSGYLLTCCYQIFSGGGLIYYLNKDSGCSFLERR